MTEQEQAKRQELAIKAGTVFTPNTPIDAKELLAGRQSEVIRMVDAINQRGQHAILFGERGVGKTSLANVLGQYLPTWGQEGVIVLAPRVNCDGGDSFGSVWRKLFDEIELTRQLPKAAGFAREDRFSAFSSAELLPAEDEKIGPDHVRRALTLMAAGAIPILIIDEFDRLSQEPRRGFADLIKSLSDHAVPATVILLGVADSVGDLISEHESVARALVQVPMPRMTQGELREIVHKGIRRIGMTIERRAVDRIAVLSQGLPHYTHLISLHAVRASIEALSADITLGAIETAIRRAIDDAQHSIRTAYHVAIRSARKDNLFADVLLACALAESDQLGEFPAHAVRKPLRAITGREYDIPAFAQHLTDFSDKKRGKILKRTGEKRRYRYRFSDPLMQPFVVMQGMVRERLPTDFFDEEEEPGLELFPSPSD